ncbi:unnamed protein product, partial [Adineta ricciae]
MLALIATLLLNLFMPVNASYSLYYSNLRQDSNRTYDCLYSYINDIGETAGKNDLHNYQLVPYCRRLDDNDEQDEVQYPIRENINKTFTFKQLKSENVT